MQKSWCKLKCTYQRVQYMNTEKKHLITNAFISSQLNYCPLTWMFQNRSLNHERCLCVIYNDGHSSYDELLNLDNSVSMHPKYLQILAIELFRVYTGSATDILNEVFPLKPPANYNLRNQQEFNIRPMKTIHYGLNSLAYVGPRIWELLPTNLKRSE